MCTSVPRVVNIGPTLMSLTCVTGYTKCFLFPFFSFRALHSQCNPCRTGSTGDAIAHPCAICRLYVCVCVYACVYESICCFDVVSVELHTDRAQN